RSSPKFAKTNSIVWMTPNEWPGAWTILLEQNCTAEGWPAGRKAGCLKSPPWPRMLNWLWQTRNELERGPEGFARGYLPLQYQRPKAAKSRHAVTAKPAAMQWQPTSPTGWRTA